MQPKVLWLDNDQRDNKGWACALNEANTFTVKIDFKLYCPFGKHYYIALLVNLFGIETWNWYFIYTIHFNDFETFSQLTLTRGANTW